MDNQIHKFIRTNGSLAENPKEAQAYPKIAADFEKAKIIQEEKCVLANTALFLVAKHLARLENNIKSLENEGVLASLPEGHNYQPSTRTTSMRRVGPSGSSSYSNTGHLKRQHTPSRASTPSGQTVASSRTTKRQKVYSHTNTPVYDEKTAQVPAVTKAEDKSSQSQDAEGETLYCFCQQGSFGNMVGCDNDNCKYEWFHYDCVGLKEPPKGVWYCPDCTTLMNKAKDKK